MNGPALTLVDTFIRALLSWGMLQSIDPCQRLVRGYAYQNCLHAPQRHRASPVLRACVVQLRGANALQLLLPLLRSARARSSLEVGLYLHSCLLLL